MGFLKKITRPISKVLDKIVPNEIKPALPFLAAAVPFLAPQAGIFGTMAGRGLLSGGANLLSQLSQEGSEGDFSGLSALLAAGTGALSAGGPSKAIGVDSPAAGNTIVSSDATGASKFFADKAAGMQPGFTKSGLGALEGTSNYLTGVGETLRTNPFSMDGLKASLVPVGQATTDLAIAENRRLLKEQEQADADAAAEQGADNASRAFAIRQSMEAYGFTEQEILDAIEAAGYRAGGRVGLKGGGMDASNPDFGGIPAAIENIQEDAEEMITIMTDNGPIQIEKSVYESMPGMFMDTTTSAYGDAGRGRPVPKFANGGRIGFDEGGMSLDEQQMEIIKGGGPKIVGLLADADKMMGTEGDRLDMALKMLLRDNEDNELLKYMLDTAEERGTTKLDVLMDLIRSQRISDISAFDRGKKSLKDDISVKDLARKEGSMKDGGLMNLGGKEMDLRKGGFVPIGKKERADDVPARLSKNEFVMTADAVRAAGGGSVNKGAKRMYDVMNKLEARA